MKSPFGIDIQIDVSEWHWMNQVAHFLCQQGKFKLSENQFAQTCSLDRQGLLLHAGDAVQESYYGRVILAFEQLTFASRKSEGQLLAEIEHFFSLAVELGQLSPVMHRLRSFYYKRVGHPMEALRSAIAAYSGYTKGEYDWYIAAAELVLCHFAQNGALAALSILDDAVGTLQKRKEAVGLQQYYECYFVLMVARHVVCGLGGERWQWLLSIAKAQAASLWINWRFDDSSFLTVQTPTP